MGLGGGGRGGCIGDGSHTKQQPAPRVSEPNRSLLFVSAWADSEEEEFWEGGWGVKTRSELLQLIQMVAREACN